MSLPVRLLEVYTPAWVKRRALSQLLAFTAAAFQCRPPSTKGLSLEGRLRQYALFTQGQVEERLARREDLPALQERLYWSAYQLGRMHGKMLRTRSIEQVMALGRVLYRILQIDFRGDVRGEVTIRRCYFSRSYSAEVCRVMSAMARGLVAGLSGGGQLVFSARITEGEPCCRARLVGPEGSR
jgi:hypothetical protein